MEKRKNCTGQCDWKIGSGLLRGVTFVLAVSVVPTTILSGCGGGGEGGVGSGSQAPFTVATDSSASGTQGAGVLLLVDLTRHPGFTDTVTVTLDNPPSGVQADTIVFSGTTTSALLPIRVTEQAAVGNHALSVIGKSGSASHGVPVTLSVGVVQPMAQEKIFEALQAGKLDYGTALLYRAYALLGDRRLPSQYQGPSLEEDNGLFTEIRKAIGTFPAAMQANLQPFIVRPADPASVWNATTPTAAASAAALQQASVLSNVLAAPAPAECPPQSGNTGAWLSKRSATNPVRVWAQCQGRPDYDAESQTLLDQTLKVLDKVYAPMTQLMGLPILDQEGGDEAIDFYILDPGTYVFRENDWRGVGVGQVGTTHSGFLTKNHGSSSFVTLSRYHAYTQKFHTTVIHEFFHVLQNTHNYEFAFRPVANASGLEEEHWFAEAAAVWAEAYFDRTLAPWDNGRSAFATHQRFTVRFQVSSEGLNATKPVPHTYSAYIWPYFVEQEKGSPDFMGQIWKGLESVTTFEQADDVIDSVHSFADHFKTFALRNLNREYRPGDPLPVEKRYVKLDDQFPDGVGPKFVTGERPVDLVADQPLKQGLSLDPLSARYLRFAPLASKENKVEFDFTGLQPQGLTDIQFLVLSNGRNLNPQWVTPPIDESSSGRVVFCWTEGATTPTFRGEFIDMVIVVSNHAKRDKVSGELVVRPTTAPCATVWNGNVLHRVTRVNGEVSTFSAVATFEYDDTIPMGGGMASYRVRSGNFTYEASIPNAGCTITQRASGPLFHTPFIGLSNTSGHLVIVNRGRISFELNTTTDFDGTQTDCHGTSSFSGRESWGDLDSLGSGQVVSDDHNTVRGSRDRGTGGNMDHLEYVFTRSGE